jgi:Cof subfamily protein (haloacid dehalogenase superfamily)
VRAFAPQIEEIPEQTKKKGLNPLKYKIVALDLDGTLLDSNGQISERHIQIIKKTSEAGIYVLLATGRYYMQTIRIINILGFEGILVTNDGAVTVKADTKEILGDFSFSIHDVAHAIHYCRDKKIHFSVCTAFDYFVESIDEFQREQCVKYETTYQIIEDILSLDEKITKFTISDNNFVGGWQELDYPNHLRKRADADFFKELVHCNTYKTNAIKNVLTQFNIQPSEMIAIGDYYNDIDMLEFAGLGIAMGNAPEEVKSRADHVTRSNDEDGVYYALENLLF